MFGEKNHLLWESNLGLLCTRCFAENYYPFIPGNKLSQYSNQNISSEFYFVLQFIIILYNEWIKNKLSFFSFLFGAILWLGVIEIILKVITVTREILVLSSLLDVYLLFIQSCLWNVFYFVLTYIFRISELRPCTMF